RSDTDRGNSLRSRCAEKRIRVEPDSAPHECPSAACRWEIGWYRGGPPSSRMEAGFVVGDDMSGPQDLKALADRAVADIAACADDAALEAARIRYLGRKDGEVTQATKQIATLPGKDKPAYGAAANDAKARIEAALKSRGDALHSASIDTSLRENIDLTLPARPVRIGRLHPVSAAIRDVSRIFGSMG